MNKHPSPLGDKRNTESNNTIGWFMIGFNTDPDHEYTFEVKKDGTILPMLDLVDISPKDRSMFCRYLADAEVHHVRFIQSPHKDIQHKPW